MTTSRLHHWVRLAKPNARLEYGRGGVVAFCCSEMVRVEVMALAAKGYLTPHRTRCSETHEVIQIVQRTQRPIPKGIKL